MSAEALTAQYQLTDADLTRVCTHGNGAVPRMDLFIDRFYEWRKWLK
jgi:hypothetical protein